MSAATTPPVKAIDAIERELFASSAQSRRTLPSCRRDCSTGSTRRPTWPPVAVHACAAPFRAARAWRAMRLGEVAHRLESAIERLAADAAPAPVDEPLLTTVDAIAYFEALQRQAFTSTPAPAPAEPPPAPEAAVFDTAPQALPPTEVPSDALPEPAPFSPPIPAAPPQAMAPRVSLSPASSAAAAPRIDWSLFAPPQRRPNPPRRICASGRGRRCGCRSGCSTAVQTKPSKSASRAPGSTPTSQRAGALSELRRERSGGGVQLATRLRAETPIATQPRTAQGPPPSPSIRGDGPLHEVQ